MSCSSVVPPTVFILHRCRYQAQSVPSKPPPPPPPPRPLPPAPLPFPAPQLISVYFALCPGDVRPGTTVEKQSLVAVSLQPDQNTGRGHLVCTAPPSLIVLESHPECYLAEEEKLFEVQVSRQEAETGRMKRWCPD